MKTANEKGGEDAVGAHAKEAYKIESGQLSFLDATRAMKSTFHESRIANITNFRTSSNTTTTVAGNLPYCFAPNIACFKRTTCGNAVVVRLAHPSCCCGHGVTGISRYQPNRATISLSPRESPVKARKIGHFLAVCKMRNSF
eukprot:15350742-Ditylum_brightwellii.AAC.1